MKVYCVLITYNPDFSILLKSLSILQSQLDKIIIVDNSDCEVSFSSALNPQSYYFQRIQTLEDE